MSNITPYAPPVRSIGDPNLTPDVLAAYAQIKRNTDFLNTLPAADLTIKSLASAPTVTWAFSRLQPVATLTLTSNTILNITGLSTLDMGSIFVIQGGSGNYTLTIEGQQQAGLNVVAVAGTIFCLDFRSAMGTIFWTSVPFGALQATAGDGIEEYIAVTNDVPANGGYIYGTAWAKNFAATPPIAYATNFYPGTGAIDSYALGRVFTRGFKHVHETSQPNAWFRYYIDGATVSALPDVKSDSVGKIMANYHPNTNTNKLLQIVKMSGDNSGATASLKGLYFYK